MRLELTGRHITITPAIRTVVQQRLAPVLRKLNDSAVSAHVVLTQQKARAHAEHLIKQAGAAESERPSLDLARSIADAG